MIELFGKETNILVEWFKNNEMKSNNDKCHLMVHHTNNRSYTSNSYIYLDNEFLENENSVNLLGVKIDENLNFNDHVNALLKKGNQKLHALMRVKKFLSEDKLKLIMKTFIVSI